MQRMSATKRKKEPVQKEKVPREQKSVKAVEVNERAVFVGNKPVMNYVLACMASLNSGSKKVIVKARGRAICRAVDAVEVLRRSMRDLQLQDIALCTEEVVRDEGRKSNVSAIEIVLIKP